MNTHEPERQRRPAGPHDARPPDDLLAEIARRVEAVQAGGELPVAVELGRRECTRLGDRLQADWLELPQFGEPGASASGAPLALPVQRVDARSHLQISRRVAPPSA